MRLFLVLFSGVELGNSGRVSPYPRVISCVFGIPILTRYERTASARFSDKTILLEFDPLESVCP